MNWFPYVLCGALSWSAVAAVDPVAGLGGHQKISVDRGARAAVNAEGVLVIQREIPAGSPAVRSAARLILKQPVDLTGKALEFELRGDAAADLIQVFLNNQGSRIPTLRADGSRNTLDAREWRKFRLEKGAADGLKFIKGGVDGSDPVKVDQVVFSIFHKQPQPGEVRMEMRNLKVVPVRGATAAAVPDGPNPFAGLGGIKAITTSPQVTKVIAPDGTLAIRGDVTMQERATAEKKFSIRLKQPVNLAGKALQFDLRTPNDKLDTLYLMLFNAGKPKASWAFYTYASPIGQDWTRFVIQRHFSPQLNWHLAWGDDSPLEAFDRIDFTIGNFGARLGGELGVDLRNFQVVDELPRLGTGLRQAAALSRSTPLVAGGKAQAEILYPDSAEGKAAAAVIADAVAKATGVRLEARPGKLEDQHFGKHTILLGNVCNNPAFRLIYGRRLTSIDEKFPGRNGWLVESVKEPLKRNVDVIVVGASDAAGLAKAAAKTAELLTAAAKGQGELAPGMLFACDYAGNLPATPPKPEKSVLEDGLAEAQKTLDTGRHQSLAGELARIGERYMRYRNRDDARLFAAVTKLYGETAAKHDPRKYGGAWGFDSDFSALNAISSFDIIEHDPALSDADRLMMTQVFTRWAHDVLRAKSQSYSWKITHNHGTFAALGAVMAGLYLQKYYPEFNDGRWLLEAGDRIFAIQNRAGKVHDDCNGYQWLSWEHTMRYAVLRPDPAVFRNGIAEHMVDTAFITMGNDRYQVPYGDTGLWTCYRAESIPLNIVALVTGEPAAEFLAQEKIIRWNGETRWGTADYGVYTKRTGRALPEPTRYNGVKLLKLDRAFFDTFPPKSGKPEFAQCFDKVSFRKSLDRDAFYMLTDGVNNGGHSHGDALSVERLMNFGRQWLADNHYYQAATRYHNSLTVVVDGEWRPYGEFAELLEIREQPDYALLSARLAGEEFDWVRHFVWFKKDDALAILDVVVPHVDGKALLRQKWNGVGAAAPSAGGYQLTQQGGVAMNLETVPGTVRKVSDDPEVGKNWASYPFAEPVIRNMEFHRESDLKRGKLQTMFTLFHGARDGKVAPAAVERLGDESIRFTRGDATWKLAPTTDGRCTVNLESQPVAPVAAVSGTAAAAAASPAMVAPQATAMAEVVLRNGAKLLAVGSADGKIRIFTPDGKLQREINLGSPVNALAAGDLSGDGNGELVAGCQDTTVRAFRAGDGAELWRYTLPFYRINAVVRVVKIADFDHNGKNEVLVGGENWRVFALEPDGKLRWHYETVRESRVIELADLDGDGTPTILCGTRYYHVTGLNREGLKEWYFQVNSPGCRAITTFALPGTKRRGVAVGADGGELFFLIDGVKKREYQTGDEFYTLATGADGKGGETVFGGSLNGCVYRFDPTGAKLWNTMLSGGVTALAPIGTGVYAGTDGGLVAQLDAAGRVVASRQLSGPVLAIDSIAGQYRALTPQGVFTLDNGK